MKHERKGKGFSVPLGKGSPKVHVFVLRFREGRVHKEMLVIAGIQLSVPVGSRQIYGTEGLRA